MNERPLVKQLLLGSNYWVLNKGIVQMFGIETAFLLSILAEAENMMSDESGWFYQTSDTIEEMTGLTRYKQDKAIEDLEKSGILVKQVRGVPAKRYFKLDYKALAIKFVNGLQSSVKENDNQVFKKLETNKESINKESINKESNIKSMSDSDESDEIPYKVIVDYLNMKTGSKYRSGTKATQRLIRARWNEGFKVEDFKKVIDVKVGDWFNDSKMAEYLRPQTLFGTKFESYLNQSLVENGLQNGGEYDDLF